MGPCRFAIELTSALKKDAKLHLPYVYSSETPKTEGLYRPLCSQSAVF